MKMDGVEEVLPLIPDDTCSARVEHGTNIGELRRARSYPSHKD